MGALKTPIFSILVPGTVAFVIPWLLPGLSGASLRNAKGRSFIRQITTEFSPATDLFSPPNRVCW
jgi:hypothetical protein